MDETTNLNTSQEMRYTLLYPNGEATATLLLDKVTGELMLLKGSIVKSKVSSQFEKLCGGILNAMRKEFIVDYCDRCPDSEDYITIEHKKVTDLQQAEILVLGNNDTQGKCWTEKVKEAAKQIMVQPKEEKDDRTIYHLSLKARGCECRMYLADPDNEKSECIVLTGSILSSSETPSYPEGYKSPRQEVIQKFCEQTTKGLQLKADYNFSSINMAATICSGMSINARTAWKDENDKTIKEMFEDIKITKI